MPGCVQFGVLVQVLRMVRVHVCKIQRRVLGCMQFGVLVQVLRTVWAHICKTEGRVLGAGAGSLGCWRSCLLLLLGCCAIL